jgi:hypothetical protein
MLNKTIDGEPMYVSVLQILITKDKILPFSNYNYLVVVYWLRDTALKTSFYLRVQPTTGAEVKPRTVDRGCYTVLAGRAYRTSQRR